MLQLTTKVLVKEIILLFYNIYLIVPLYPSDARGVTVLVLEILLNSSPLFKKIENMHAKLSQIFY